MLKKTYNSKAVAGRIVRLARNSFRATTLNSDSEPVDSVERLKTLEAAYRWIALYGIERTNIKVY